MTRIIISSAYEFYMVHKSSRSLKDFVGLSDNISVEDGEVLRDAIDRVAGAILGLHRGEVPKDLPWVVRSPNGIVTRHPNRALANLEADQTGGEVVSSLLVGFL